MCQRPLDAAVVSKCIKGYVLAFLSCGEIGASSQVARLPCSFLLTFPSHRFLAQSNTDGPGVVDQLHCMPRAKMREPHIPFTFRVFVTPEQENYIKVGSDKMMRLTLVELQLIEITLGNAYEKENQTKERCNWSDCL